MQEFAENSKKQPRLLQNQLAIQPNHTSSKIKFSVEAQPLLIRYQRL